MPRLQPRRQVVGDAVRVGDGRHVRKPREPFDRSIDIRIGRLRRKIEPEPGGEPRCIRTVRNAGYMYVPLGG